MKHSFIIFFLISINFFAQIFVSPDGNDTNSGTIDSPLASIVEAMNLIQPQDTIYLLAGVYKVSEKISITKNGYADSLYCLFGYNGERALLDFSSMEVNSSNRGISLSGTYWHIYGIDVKGAGDNGMHVSGSFNRIEFCTFYENNDTGLQIGNGASDNQIINCDSYFNADPGQGNADGFAPKLDVGSNNYFYGCRAWQNSDDGWDGYMRGNDDVSTILENCWSFKNGYLKSGNASSGNGNGFKLGGSDDKTLMHNFTLKNCVAFDNRIKGFDQNNNKGSMILYNCTAYRNGTNYSIVSTLNDGKIANVTNSISLGNYGTLDNFVEQQTNSWFTPFTVTEEDFISIDTLGVRGPRKSDGSLPDINFLHLANGSDLIDAGIDVGISFIGTTPDLGAFEFDPNITGVLTNEKIKNDFTLEQNYPNPFNPNTSINFSVKNKSFVKLEVFDVVGRKIKTLVNDWKNSGNYKINFEAKELSSGIYFYILNENGQIQTKKMTLVK
ncbi:MAG: right-handed parallel beta-helix repeat-containing protein [Ignavibacteriales bacterium]|nr:right-handed parallel beta-helix repeat-containing protein [Ignavibacteriales bacterium]MCB9211055.1 right-handed parallel beta-helix repeat-containing protein [Ignavibacteriales bacterium]MCB9219472.1 right-handed parallel beta-helix repeat-containing protein [Ignavibacteriales bacterium]MCB9259854.1 right-handed parallel beta-helix repeat-containing protein [Ignavibacteriales bacterium]